MRFAEQICRDDVIRPRADTTENHLFTDWRTLRKIVIPYETTTRLRLPTGRIPFHLTIYYHS